MVDFSSARRTSSKPRGNKLFLGAVCIVGLVAFALLEPTFRAAAGGTVGASLTDPAAR